MKRSRISGSASATSCWPGRVRGHDEERRAVERVGARREHRHGLGATLDLEVDVGTDRAADPVALHLDDLLRPEALELVEVIEQTVGVVGDLEVPLRELLLLDHRAAAVGRAIGQHLLVREHGLVVRAPVDRALLAVRQTALVELAGTATGSSGSSRRRSCGARGSSRTTCRRRAGSSSAGRCSRRSTRAGRPRAGWRRSRPADRRSPSRSG